MMNKESRTEGKEKSIAHICETKGNILMTTSEEDMSHKINKIE
jgi:hypothetical protein